MTGSEKGNQVPPGPALPRAANKITDVTGDADDAAGVAERLRATFRTGRTRPLAWRHQQLGELVALLGTEDHYLTEAMAEDLGKPRVEAWLTDIAAVRKDIQGIDANIERWAAPRPVHVPWTLMPARAEVIPEPLGVALVMAPWNYPVRCLVLPLAFALAAGNTVAAKPSELAPATSAVLAELLSRRLDPDTLAVVEGGPETGRHLLEQHWDHIFFTGGGRVGRLVMAAAANHLTPVTLELGGKNPAIVTASADLGAAARRIVWGKFLNAGQTCVAPDYVLVDKVVEEDLLGAMTTELRRSFGPDPAESPDLARVVNQAHMERLLHMLGTTEGTLVTGGQADMPARYLAPAIVRSVGWADPLMSEEIFGPVLPVLAYDDLPAAIEELNRRDKPLALYLYSKDDRITDEVLAQTSSGTVCVNHNAVQLGVPGLPFGGVGASGMGAYHGQAGFDNFSHCKGVLRKPARGEVPLVYPPYTRAKEWVLRRALR